MYICMYIYIYMFICIYIHMDTYRPEITSPLARNSSLHLPSLLPESRKCATNSDIVKKEFCRKLDLFSKIAHRESFLNRSDKPMSQKLPPNPPSLSPSLSPPFVQLLVNSSNAYRDRNR